MKGKIVVVVGTAEGEVKEAFCFGFLAHAEAFAHGWSAGGNCYGAGWCEAFVEGSEDLADLEEREPGIHAGVVRAIKKAHREAKK